MKTKQSNIRIGINLSQVLLIILTLVLMLSSAGKTNEIKMNKYCPVTTTELAEEQFFVDYNGQRIYFCCNKCKKDFLADPEAYLANLSYDEASTSEQDHNTTSVQSTTQPITQSKDNETHTEETDHDHTTDHAGTSSLVTFFGKFHPMLTHFPIALILTSLLFSAIGFLQRTSSFDTISVYLMYVASLSGIATVILGLLAGSGATYPTFLIDYFTTHRFLGITTGVFTLVTSYFGFRLLRDNRKDTLLIYRLLLLLTAILVGVTGHFGATLVFGPDYFNL